MRRHARAATAGSTQRQATGLGLFVRGAFVTRASAHRVDGSGAPAATRQRSLVPLTVAVVFGLALLCSARASAAEVLHSKELFGSAAQPTFADPTAMAVDPATGDLLVADKTAGTISRFKPNGEPDDFSALGTNVISEGEGPLNLALASESQIAVDNSGTITDGDIYVTRRGPAAIEIFARSGEYLGQLSGFEEETFHEACGVTTDPSGNVYVGDYRGNGAGGGLIPKFTPTANPVTNADFVAPLPEPEFACALAAGAGPTTGSLFVLKFGSELFKVNASTGEVDYSISGADGASTLAVDPETGNLLVAKGTEVIEYDASGSSEAVEVTRLAAASPVQGIAPGPSGVLYVSREGAPKLEVWDHVVVPSVAVNPATTVPPDGATLRGVVNPEGVALSDCRFEYGPISSPSFDQVAVCDPTAAEIPAKSANRSVTGEIAGLADNTTYKYRLVASNANGTARSETGTFTTPGPPQIGEIRALNADQTSATLEARVNPSGFPTRYRFEWGPTAAYGKTIPGNGFEPSLGSGDKPVLVTAELSGLSSGSVYHYRVVATGGEGRETASPDQIVETLNSCGLPEGRCFELVSPRDVGPVDLPGQFGGAIELHYLAARASGAIAYVSETGLPDATKGAEVLSRAVRGPAGWVSKQLSPPITALNESAGGSSASSIYFGLNEEVSCGFVASNQPLTDDAGTRATLEAGGASLYRQNPDGSFTAVTRLTPEDPEVAGGELPLIFHVQGFSQDCGKVVFSVPYRYPGVPSGSLSANPDEFLYEWDEGELRGLGYVPDSVGEVLVPASAGSMPNPATDTAVVSADGSRVFFNANRATSPNPGEIGQRGVFVREDGETTRDLSLSKTSTPDTEANFQFATKDGARAFFIANAGLTEEASSEGKDLYEYDLESNSLTDLSPEEEVGGAAVVGFIGASADGSHVYFAAAGQLVPGKGKSSAENLNDGTYSVYGEEDGHIDYVGVVAKSKIDRVVVGPGQSAQVSPSGRYLVFESTANVTGYESGNEAPAAYLYDADAPTEATVCLSCRQDGQPSANRFLSQFNRLANAGPKQSFSMYRPRAIVERGGQALVFFSSFDALAPGAQSGVINTYEWVHGQIFRIATEPPGLRSESLDDPDEFVRFLGASEDGSDFYSLTPQTLNWEDGDERSSVYDARIGGGFAEPPPDAAPCDPAAELSCQGASVTPLPTTPAPATRDFSGPGNPKSQKQHKKKQHKKKQHKKKHKARHANGDRRTSK